MFSFSFIWFYLFANYNAGNSYQLWISKDYMTCLQKRLTCECNIKLNSKIIAAMLEVDSSGRYVAANFFNAEYNEYDDYYLSQNGKREYKIVPIYNNSTVNDSMYNLGLGRMLFKNNKLYYTNSNNFTTLFVKGANYSLISGDEFAKYNIVLLNQAFVNRGLKKLESVLGFDSLSCSCNRYYGMVNLISSGSKSWVIEQHNDSIYIYRYIGSLRLTERQRIRNLQSNYSQNSDGELWITEAGHDPN